MYVFNNLRDMRYFLCPKILKSRHLNYWLTNYLLNKYSLCIIKNMMQLANINLKMIRVLLMLAFMIPSKSKLSILNYILKNAGYKISPTLYVTWTGMSEDQLAIHPDQLLRQRQWVRYLYIKYIERLAFVGRE